MRFFSKFFCMWTTALMLHLMHRMRSSAFSKLQCRPFFLHLHETVKRAEINLIANKGKSDEDRIRIEVDYGLLIPHLTSFFLCSLSPLLIFLLFFSLLLISYPFYHLLIPTFFLLFHHHCSVALGPFRG